jgi:hypothetical protein
MSDSMSCASVVIVLGRCLLDRFDHFRSNLDATAGVFHIR